MNSLRIPWVVTLMSIMSSLAVAADLPTREQIMAMQPPDAFKAVMGVLSSGNQIDAEHLLDALVAKYPDDQPLAFFQAACTRSRFAIRQAAPQFQAVVKLNPGTIEGRCAQAVLMLDAGREIEKNWTALMTLADRSPKQPLIVWMAAVQCRAYRNLEFGVAYYEQLSKLWNPGPVLMHQTYANLLDGLERYVESLPHRDLAVKMEPCGWTYQARAVTLVGLKRYEEADRDHARAIEDQPDSCLYWWTWGECLREWGRLDQSMEKLNKAKELDPRNEEVWTQIGWTLEKMNRPAQAVENFETALQINPRYRRARTALLRVLRASGQSNKADQLEKQWLAEEPKK